jgi:hypothetical protein
MTLLLRAALLLRVHALVERVRLHRGNASASILDELGALEQDATETEALLAAAIDADMDRRYRRHNVPEPEPARELRPEERADTGWRTRRRTPRPAPTTTDTTA